MTFTAANNFTIAAALEERHRELNGSANAERALYKLIDHYCEMGLVTTRHESIFLMGLGQSEIVVMALGEFRWLRVIALNDGAEVAQMPAVRSFALLFLSRLVAAAAAGLGWVELVLATSIVHVSQSPDDARKWVAKSSPRIYEPQN